MIKINELSVEYNDLLALNSISLDISEGKIVGIIGPNGAGKSTLLKAILDILPHEGNVFIDQVNIKTVLKKVAYVEQKSDIDTTFPIKVKEVVSMGTYPQLRIFQKLSAIQWSVAREALTKVGLTNFSNRQIGTLSGGQFQRVLLARCLSQKADYILLDEPFVGIDLVSEKIIMDILVNLKKEGKTILVVHHDLNKVKEYFDDLIILNKKLIAYGDVSDVFTGENLKEAYGDSVFMGEV